ncbi:hypothetical protein U2F10_35995 [Leptothoe sp. EHU-05/26/07-4]
MASNPSTSFTVSRLRTPFVVCDRFAKWAAILARVLVGAMPTDTGILVHCLTVRRMVWP